MKYKKIYSILSLFSLIWFLFPNAKTLAYVIPNLDYDGMKKGEKYTIDFPVTKDYYYHDTWPVFLSGDKISPTATPRGYMMLQKPQNPALSNLGRTFAYPDLVRDWALVFNGNPDFVENFFYNGGYYTLTNQKTKREYLRAYSRDIARESGANISMGSFGIPDGKGGTKGYVVVTPTPYPSGQISVPSTVNAGDSVSIDLSGQEFSPYRDYIEWNFSINGQSVQNSTVYSSTFNKTVSKTFTQPGTYTLKLTVTDEVERTTTVQKTITVKSSSSGGGSGGGGTPPSDGGGGSNPSNPPEKQTFYITVRHVDSDTGRVLSSKTDAIQEGNSYSYSSYPKGYFKDSQGNPYVPSPENQYYSGVADQNKTITFTYRVSLPDPSTVVKKPGNGEELTGYIFWELRRDKQNEASKVYIESKFPPVGNYYAMRNYQLEVKGNGFDKTSTNPNTPVSLMVDTDKFKDNPKIDYNVKFEYTNYYHKNYVCTENQGGECFRWEYTGDTPAWEYAQTFSLADWYSQNGGKSGGLSLTVDPMQHNSVYVNTIEDLANKQFPVGKRADWDNRNSNPVVEKTYYETFEKATNSKVDSMYKLKTQTHFPIAPGPITYKVELPSGQQQNSNYQPFIKEGAYGSYFPVDLDESLKGLYPNNTVWKYGKYAIPLQQVEMKDQKMDGKKRQYEVDITSDFLFVSKHLGYLGSYPLAKDAKNHYVTDSKLPSKEEMAGTVKEQMKDNFKKETGQTFDDEVLTNQDTPQYYVPVDAKSPLKPKQVYENKVVLSNMGLNDLNLVFGQKFSFDHYLLGAIEDDAFVVEQRNPRVNIKNYPHSLTITQDQAKEIRKITRERPGDFLFGYRVTDRDFYQKLQKIINLGL
ncbi:PKD domain-containing protein [Bacillus sp. FSL W8-1127]|uniref:PKD domain-containing protein n=1 Tax=Bacillus sp. FSL W8-1127 TaxID=2954710 RepID=UPI0030FB7D7C